MSNYYSEIISIINEMEVKYNATEFKYRNIYAWGEVRRFIIESVKKDNNVKRNGLVNARNMAKKCPAKFKLHRLKEVDVLVFESNYKYLDANGVYHCNVTSNVEHNFDNNLNIIRVEEQTYGGKEINDFNEKYYSAMEGSFLDSIAKKMKKEKLDTHFLEVLIKDINMLLGKKVICIKKLKRNLNKFLMEYHYYQFCFNNCKPKAIVVPYAYNRTAIIMAAKDMLIKTVDVQGNAIDTFHEGYYYPNHKEIKYLADTLLVWSKYWVKDFMPTIITLVTKNRIVDKVANELKYDKLYYSSNITTNLLYDTCIKENSITSYYMPHPYEKVNDGTNIINHPKDYLDEINMCHEFISSYTTGIYEALYLKKIITLIDDVFLNLVDVATKLDYIDSSVFYDNKYENVNLDSVFIPEYEPYMDLEMFQNAMFSYKIMHIIDF